VDEIKFGDNDRLAAQVSNLADADTLVILTDVDGLYDRNPKTDKNAQLIGEVRSITPEIVAGAGGAGSIQGTGGMATKIQAARIVNRAGIPMLIASGRCPDILRRLFGGESVGTCFHPQGDRLSGRKRWIAFSRRTGGVLVVDDGAREALLSRGKSLLPSGVVRITGDFEFGDVVKVQDTEGVEIAIGVVRYGSKDLLQIRGKQTRDIVSILGRKDYDEVIHRDDMVVNK
jgi:glutamate 5-kinase